MANIRETDSILFRSLLLLFLIHGVCSSGYLISFPFDAKIDVGIKLTAEGTGSFLVKRNTMASSVEDLDSLLGSSANVDLSFCLVLSILEFKQQQIFKYSTFSFLKSKLMELPPHVNISSIIVNGNGAMEPLLFLPALQSIHYALRSLNLQHRMKVAPLLSLALVENLCNNHVSNLQGLIEFLNKHDSYIVIEITAKKQKSCVDLCDIGIPVVLKVQDSEDYQGGKQAPSFISKVVESMKPCFQTNRAFQDMLVEIPSVMDSGIRKKHAMNEEKFSSAHRLLLDPTIPSGVVTVPSTLPPPLVPVTNPVTTTITYNPFPPATIVTPGPGTAQVSPSYSGQSWCVAISGASEAALQIALDYACGIGEVDCSPIQPSGSCFNPNTFQDHASYAFNSYYQKHLTPASCDFGGTAVLVQTDPNVCTDSVTTPTTAPATNPTSPVTTTPPSTLPPYMVPVTTPDIVPPPPPLVNPVTNPLPPPSGIIGGTTPGTIPVSPGNGAQVWCVAKTDASDAALETSINYACGFGADCSAIQMAGSCYVPNTLRDHASYAFNSFYQKNPTPSSCDFGGTATLVSANPSSGTCTYPASSSSSPVYGTGVVPSTVPGTVPGDGTSTTVFGSSNPIIANSSVISGSSTSLDGRLFFIHYSPVLALALITTFVT